MPTALEEPPSRLPVPAAIRDGLRSLGLIDGQRDVYGAPLAGGVSSDVWQVELGPRTVCVKRPLERLRVEGEWRLPRERLRFEQAWLELASELLPGAVPAVLAGNEAVLVLEWLSPLTHANWKSQLLGGKVEPSVARRLGRTLGTVHKATAGDASVRRRFSTDALFQASRLEPYFTVTARAHPDLASTLHRLRDRTGNTHLVLVHGDVSPKNVLVAPDGPVLIDAECAWFGDPAFDVGFCVNHLLLKSLHVPGSARQLAIAALEFVGEYLTFVSWEPVAEIEARVAELVPALMLARVDGMSPVEYLTEAERAGIRALARGLLARPPSSTAELIGDVVHAGLH